MILRINPYSLNPKATEALGGVKKHISNLEKKLIALIELRVSQINGCVYCVDKHSQEGREAGETQQRLDTLVVWQESPLFTEAEKAAFAWAESLTNIELSRAPDEVYETVREHFTDQQVVDIAYVVAIIGARNRVAVGFRHLPDERKAQLTRAT